MASTSSYVSSVFVSSSSTSSFFFFFFFFFSYIYFSGWRVRITFQKKYELVFITISCAVGEKSNRTPSHSQLASQRHWWTIWGGYATTSPIESSEMEQQQPQFRRAVCENQQQLVEQILHYIHIILPTPEHSMNHLYFYSLSD